LQFVVEGLRSDFGPIHSFEGRGGSVVYLAHNLTRNS
jgi:hypothetical protein